MKFICPSNEYLFGKINEFTNGMKDVFRRGKKSEHFSWEHIVNFISFSWAENWLDVSSRMTI